MGRENISYSKEYKELIPYREYELLMWRGTMVCLQETDI